MVLKILLSPPTEGISITGAQIYFTVPMPLQPWPITESQVNSALVILSILGLCLYLTHGIRARVKTRRQLIAEWMVEKLDGMVLENMGEYFKGFGPFIRRPWWPQGYACHCFGIKVDSAFAFGIKC
jgi:F-type H+-transporting ATPase subunit a